MSVEYRHFDLDYLNKHFDMTTHKGILEVAMRITAQAKGFQQHQITGRLRNAISWKVGKEEGGLNDSGGENAESMSVKPESELEGLVGANTKYAEYHEFGTRYLKPFPFLRPAIALIATPQNLEAISKKISEEMAKGNLTQNKMRVDFFK